MRWYVNDTSLQGQFNDVSEFIDLLELLLSSRNKRPSLKTAMYLTRSIVESQVTAIHTFRQAISSTNNTELRRVVLQWLDRNGPFIEDDRLAEVDDYFECFGHDVTDSGLGEAARRYKARLPVLSFSFIGGNTDFGLTPITVHHGIPEDRLGSYSINNLSNIEALETSALEARPAPTNWEQLVIFSREQYEHLLIPDSVFTNAALSREPFETTISDRVLALFSHLNNYMANREPGGNEGVLARQIIEDYFTGARALFSGESPSNQDQFRADMTFVDPENEDRKIFAHWHGKISRRFFRMHFEWPIAGHDTRIKILYVGPKITRH
ncbi:hypothetical protein D3C71_734560 [compost metagenome]